ncbi:hypothetical protein GS896_25780 [Rhodococcus hoagii]|nr:hypothetical protein [Prescottella equi]MBM4654083.1 hypothetical protein [Prescottella equi]MBM4719557.1 hypothetical protein [Prescottella equi]NKR23356.1 hypothetical protein [Prescottella equi]NKT56033.1 hypothetical protein [Prescottella equi]
MPGHDNTIPLTVGTRVFSRGEQYPDALWYGTGIIVEVIKQHRVDNTWEYRVKKDTGETVECNIVDTPIGADEREALGLPPRAVAPDQ